jgi:trehalose 6-phosphate synthase
MNRLVVVSNRVPDLAAGAQAGGLAVALEALMQRRGGLWFGWSGKISDTPTNQATKSSTGDIEFATIDLSQEEHDRYYNGFSNSVLWPILHSLTDLMTFDRRSAQVYAEVNKRMAASLTPLLKPTDMIWVHDYHLMQLPAVLRARGVQGPIGFFLHVPFPTPDVFNSAPDAKSLLRDLLASDLIGFQTPNDVENFAMAAQKLLGALKLSDGTLSFNGRRIRLGAFPVEIEPREFAALAASSYRNPATDRLRRSTAGQCLIIGVDRLDPTKGLVQRLEGFRRLLETHENWRRNVTMLQIAASSRQDVASYRDLRLALERSAGSINAEWGEADWTPLRVIARAVARGTMAGYMRVARAGVVTPLRDGMNLVAKEFVAAQDPQDPGVLVLSRFAGAARQLGGSLLVNPHDPDEIAEAINAALGMSLQERQDRWQQNWRAIEGTSALAWGRSFVAALIKASQPIIAPTRVPTVKEPTGMLPSAEPIKQGFATRPH